MNEARKADPAGIVVAALLAVTAGAIAFDASRLELGQTYGLGPKAMPYVVAVGLRCSRSETWSWACAATCRRASAAIPRRSLLILGGLAILIAIIGFGGGFIPATTILFAMTAAAFGRARIPRRSRDRVRARLRRSI